MSLILKAVLKVMKSDINIKLIHNNRLTENWRKRYNKELMQLLGDLDILSFVRINRLKWTGHVNRMDSKRKVIQVFNNNPQGHRLRGRPRNRWRNFVQTDINRCKVEMTGRSPLRRRRSSLDCRAI
jgi:hypothetical protein